MSKLIQDRFIVVDFYERKDAEAWYLRKFAESKWQMAAICVQPDCLRTIAPILSEFDPTICPHQYLESDREILEAHGLGDMASSELPTGIRVLVV